MPKYVVVDENNKWLYYGEAENPMEALLEAKESDLYDANADIYVYEIAKERRYSPYLHSTLTKEMINTILEETKP